MRDNRTTAEPVALSRVTESGVQSPCAAIVRYPDGPVRTVQTFPAFVLSGREVDYDVVILRMIPGVNLLLLKALVILHIKFERPAFMSKVRMSSL